jgi:hypothetical protein
MMEIPPVVMVLRDAEVQALLRTAFSCLARPLPDQPEWYAIGPTYVVSMRAQLIGRAATRVPGLKRLPVMKLLAIGEIALLARDHVRRLDPSERRRLVALVRKGRHLAADEREELAELVAKAEPRRFAGLVADKLSPVPLPRRLVNGAPPKRTHISTPR